MKMSWHRECCRSMNATGKIYYTVRLWTLLLKQNKDAFMKEGSAMCEELDKIINAKLDAREERGRNEGRSEGRS